MSDRLREARRLIQAMADFLENADLVNPADDLKVEEFLERAEKWLRVADSQRVK